MFKFRAESRFGGRICMVLQNLPKNNHILKFSSVTK